MSASKGIFEILELERDDLEYAFEIENKYQEAGFGFVDSTCFALCEKYKIQKVFTYDRKHFRLYKPSFSDFLDLLPPE
jgi:predicted nucleic acid-binding protein